MKTLTNFRPRFFPCNILLFRVFRSLLANGSMGSSPSRDASNGNCISRWRTHQHRHFQQLTSNTVMITMAIFWILVLGLFGFNPGEPNERRRSALKR